MVWDCLAMLLGDVFGWAMVAVSRVHVAAGYFGLVQRNMFGSSLLCSDNRSEYTTI
jgi:hypothetical protein